MTEEGVEQIYDEFHTPVHVRQHCLQVARVGKLIADELLDAGVEIDPELVWMAGLIHDFIRVVDFKELPSDLGTKEDQIVWANIRNNYHGHHADVGAQILEEMGETVLAKIVKRHKHINIVDDPPKTWEEKVIYYADKRVTHGDIVSVESRINEGFARHFPDQEVPQDELERRAKIDLLEKEIFNQIDLNPEDLVTELGS